MPVLVVVEGLSRELAEEVGPVPEAAGAMVPARGTAGGRQGLRAAAAAHAAVGRKEESGVGQRDDKNVTHSDDLVCVFLKRSPKSSISESLATYLELMLLYNTNAWTLSDRLCSFEGSIITREDSSVRRHE